MSRISRWKSRARRAAILPIVAVCIVILFVAAALAIDIARIHVTRAELRTATDAAARAAVDTLSRTQSVDQARLAAQQIALENDVAGEPLQIAADRIVFGRSSAQADGSFAFVAGDTPFNSARVTGERIDGSPSGSVSLFFGPIFGVSDFQPVQVSSAMRLDRDIGLVLDVSGSMGNFGRIDALRNAVAVFLAELNNSQADEFVSLSVYSTSARPVVAMTNNMAAIQAGLDSQNVGGRTAIGEGLQVGLNSVRNDPQARGLAEKTIIVMTDGNQNEGVSPAVIARTARDQDVVVHTITFSRGANQSLMRTVAQTTGGIHLHADNNQDLIDAFQEMARQLQVLTIE